ncbi:MAG: response regulator transcription factor [Anaerolineales bacterium]|nr:response regulator transcription factor [Anaerolineales bacterium]
MPTVLLVDDDAFNREGVRLFLSRAGFEILEAGDEAAAWHLITTRPPEAAIVDISIPPDAHTPPAAQHAFGLRLAENIKQNFPNLGVVLFSAFDDRGGELLKLIQAGHRGLAYQLKGRAPSKLLAALQDVLAGRVVIDPEVQFNRRTVAADLLRQISADERPWVERVLENLNTLTPREQDVVQRLAASHNTEGIAQALSVTPKTAENYITNVYDKLGLNEMGRTASHLRKVVVLAKACMMHELKG